MGNFRPIATKCWIAFVNFMGYSYNRTNGSHDIYTKINSKRSIVLRSADKDVPALHLKTSCKTMGIELQYVYTWATKNC